MTFCHLKLICKVLVLEIVSKRPWGRGRPPIARLLLTCDSTNTERAVTCRSFEYYSNARSQCLGEQGRFLAFYPEATVSCYEILKFATTLFKKVYYVSVFL
jgi:hypothetical protein